MAKIASVNADCSQNGGAAAIWNLVDLLVNGGGGWSIVAASDGSSASLGAVTGPGTGTGGLNNQGAYIVIREPSGGSGRRYFFQRGADDATWWVRYMRSGAQVTGGTATAMPAPTPDATGTIENLLGTSAAGAQMFDTAGAAGTRNYLAHAVSFDAPVNGAYFFSMFCTIRSTGAPHGVLFAAPMTQKSVGDEDPLVLGCAGTLAATRDVLNVSNQSASSRRAYLRWGSPAPAFVAHWSAFTGVTAANEYTGSDDVFGISFLHSRTSPTPGIAFKGYTEQVLQSGRSNMSYPSTINFTTNAYVYTAAPSSSANSAILFPWPNGVIPQV